MTDASPANSPSASSIPADDPARVLTVVDPDGAGVPHISVAGGTYTILVSGAQTAGRYCLVDMLVPAGGGPPPHRHDFEEMFSLLEGELEFTFRGKSHTVRAGSTVNVPANAPHAFKNLSGKTARMLCMCTPAGQDEFFLAVDFPRRRPHIATAEADPGRDGREGKTDRGPAAEISHRDGQDVRRTRLTDSQEWTAAAA